MKLFAGLLLTVMLMASAVSPGQASYEQANTLFAAGKFPQAALAVEESLRLDPKLVPALTLKAKMQMADNHFEAAGRTLERALLVDPKAEYAQFLYGLAAFLSNDMAQALPRFRKARQLNPSNPRTARYLGITCESLGQIEEALLLYRDAVRLERVKGPVDAETLLPGARLLFLLGQLDESERWIREAIAVAPKFRDAHFELARVLLKKGDSEAAADAGEKALVFTGAIVTDAQIHYLLIHAWSRSGMPERAAKHAETLRAIETPLKKEKN